MNIQKIFFALNNPYRLKIYEICFKEKLNSTQLSLKLGISYKSTFANVKILEKAGMIEKKERVVGNLREVILTSIPFKKETIYEKVYKVFIKDLKENETKISN